MSGKGARVSTWEASLLVAGSVFIAFLLGEVGIRIVHPSASLWRYPNYIALATRPDPDQPTEVLRYDPLLGWAPQPGASGILMHQPISYSADGLRNQNRGLDLAVGRPLLVVGDSYTEGFGVKGDESWPAHLERTPRRRVLNGAVRGYGLDQMILRAEVLAEAFKPDAIVVGFIALDIGRSAVSIFESAHKPYFVAVGDRLDLMNVPVPTTPVTAPQAWPRRILGHSYLLDFIMRRLGATHLWYGADVSTGQDPEVIACGLMDRLAALVRKHSARGLVVSFPQYNAWTNPTIGVDDRKRTSVVLTCARSRGLETLDTYDAFAKAGAGNNLDSLYVEWHFNDRGNALAAGLIADVLRRSP